MDPVPELPLTKEERNWALFAHLSPLLVGLATGGTLVFAGPLVIWLMKRDESEFVADQAKEALNFQITVSILAVVCVPLVFVLIGIPMLIALGIAEIVLSLIAAVRASEGERYRYPFALRLIA